MVTDLERLLQVAKQQQDYKPFLQSYLSNSQIFLDPHVDACQCGYTTNVWRKTTIWIFLQIPYTKTTKTGMDFVRQFLFYFFQGTIFSTARSVENPKSGEEMPDGRGIDGI
jgi:hypothetical protein